MSDGRTEAMRGSYFSKNKYAFVDQRITNENITYLEKDQVFVFGSNESGIHGGGAAKQALTWGAEYGNPEGIQGDTYAIPTKDKSVFNTLTVDQIRPYVDRFLLYAMENENKTFFVTEIGCGLAGLTPEEVAPLFKGATFIKNIHLPKRFWDIIK